MGDVVLRVVAEKGSSVEQVIAEVQAGFRGMADSARSAVASMSLAEAQSAITSLTSTVINLGGGFVSAAKEVSGIKRELSTVASGAELKSLVSEVRELSLTTGFSNKEIADMVRQMRNLGPVSESSMRAAMDMAAGTGMSLQAVGRNYELIAEGGQGAERALLQLAKAGGITVEEMRKAGAEVSNGKLLTDTPEQAERARLALEKLASSKWLGAAEKMQSAGDRLSKELGELKADIGEQAAAWEAWATRGMASVVHVVGESLPSSLKGAIGITADLAGHLQSLSSRVLGLGASLAQIAIAVPVVVSHLASKQAATVAAAAADNVASKEALKAAQARFAEAASHAQASLAAEAEATVQRELAAEHQFAAQMAMEEGEAQSVLVAEHEAAAAAAAEEAAVLTQLAAAHQADAVSAEQQAVAETQAAAGSQASAVSFAALRTPIIGIGVAALTAAGYIGMLGTFGDNVAGMLNNTLGTSFKTMAQSNREAEQQISDANAAEIHALSQHAEMVGKTADEYRAMGKKAGDVTQVVIALRDKLEEARKNGASQGEIDKISAQLQTAIQARGELAQSEGQVRQATVDTKSALESTEHAYKLNEASIQDLIAAHQAHIVTLRHEIEQVGENSVKGQELLKQERSEQETVYQLQRQRTDDLLSREKDRYQLGKTGYAQMVAAAREHVQQLENEHAKDADVMKAKIELSNLVKHRLEEEMQLRRQLADFEFQHARNTADFSRRFAREGAEDSARRRVTDAQQAVETAKQVQAAHRAVGIEDVNDVLRVRNAQLAAAGQVYDQKKQHIRDEVANVQDAERTKVEAARQSYIRQRNDYDRLAKTPGVNEDDLRKASQNLEQARQNWVTSYSNGQQAIKEASRKADQEIYENDAELASKRQALDAEYETARLASIERIKEAELKQTEDVANTRADFLKKAMDAEAGSATPDTNRLQTLSNGYIAEKRKAQEAAYARDEKSAEDNAEKLFGMEVGREQEKQQYLETQRKLLRARMLNDEIQTLEQVMDLYKNAADKGPLQSLRQQHDDLQRQLAELDGFDKPIQQAAKSANDGKAAVDGYSASVRQSSSDADRATSSNNNLASSYGRVATAANAANAAQAAFMGHKLADYSPSASYGVSSEKPQGRSPSAFGYDPDLTKPEDTRTWDRSDWESARNAGYKGTQQTPASAGATPPAGYDWARGGGYDWQRAGAGAYDWQQRGGSPTSATPYGGEGPLPAGYTTAPSRVFVPPDRLPDPTGFWSPRPDMPDDGGGGSQTVVHATNFISMGGGLAPAPVRDAVTALNDALARTMASPNRWGELGVT